MVSNQAAATGNSVIRVFVGSSEKYADIELPMAHSIYRHASQAVSVTFLRPGEHGLKAAGCTGFTMFRYAIPELCDYEGYAIYLDVDMILLADIAELWQYKTPGRWAALKDGSREVMVIDCSAGRMPKIKELHKFSKWQLDPPLKYCIPNEWNCEDCAPDGAKLIHFTDLTRQPWFTDRNDAATALMEENARDFMQQAQRTAQAG